jgi:hypothetical protein
VPALEASGDPEFLLDGGLQTGGLGVVVSFGAVGDLDVHACSSFPARLCPVGRYDDIRRRGTRSVNRGRLGGEVRWLGSA